MVDINLMQWFHEALKYNVALNNLNFYEDETFTGIKQVGKLKYCLCFFTDALGKI